MAEGMDDLLKALGSFNDGLRSLQMTRVLDNANSTVEQIRSSDLDAKQKRAELSNIAQQLTMKMVGLGGSVGAAKELADTIQGPKLPSFQSADQMIGYGLINNDEAAITAGTKIKEIDAKNELEKQKLLQQQRYDLANFNQGRIDNRQEDKQVFSLGSEGRNTLSKTQSNFNKNVKELDDASRYAKQALAILNSDGPASKMMGAVQFLTARASGSNSQLSDAEREAVNGRQDLISKLKQSISSNTTSEFIKENKEALKGLLEVYANSSNTMKEQIANTYTGQLKSNPLFADYDYNDITSRLTGGRIKQYTGPGIEISSESNNPGIQAQGPTSPNQPSQPVNIPGITLRPKK